MYGGCSGGGYIPGAPCWLDASEPDRRPRRAYSGLFGCIRYRRRWVEAFDEHTTEVSEYLDLGEYIAIIGRITARGREGGVETSEDEARLIRFRNGRAIAYHECGKKADAVQAAAAGLSE